MKISTRVRYGMRVMVNLASRSDAGYVLLKDIAREEAVSLKYLSLIMIPLRVRGLVLASRGASGGYRLARPASRISARDVFEAVDGPIVLVDCVGTAALCERAPQCPTIKLWARVSKAITDTLAATSLEDMAAEQIRLRKTKATKSAV